MILILNLIILKNYRIKIVKEKKLPIINHKIKKLKVKIIMKRYTLSNFIIKLTNSKIVYLNSKNIKIYLLILIIYKYLNLVKIFQELQILAKINIMLKNKIIKNLIINN
jgi:hypothetical protein